MHPGIQEKFKFPWHIRKEETSEEDDSFKEGDYYISTNVTQDIRRKKVLRRIGKKAMSTLNITKSQHFIRKWTLDDTTTRWLDTSL